MSNHYKTRKDKIKIVLEWMFVITFIILIASLITCVFLYGTGVLHG